MNKNRAFTLIELLVVIAIISILMAIVITNLTQAKAKSRDAKRVSDIAQLQLALEIFFDRCNRYPVVDSTPPVQGSIIPDIDDTGNGCPSGIELETFISRIPTPPIALDYAYGVNANPADYILRAKFETDNPSLLVDDSDDTIYGVDCADSNKHYCVGPK